MQCSTHNNPDNGGWKRQKNRCLSLKVELTGPSLHLIPYPKRKHYRDETSVRFNSNIFKGCKERSLIKLAKPTKGYLKSPEHNHLKNLNAIFSRSKVNHLLKSLGGYNQIILCSPNSLWIEVDKTSLLITMICRSYGVSRFFNVLDDISFINSSKPAISSLNL